MSASNALRVGFSRATSSRALILSLWLVAVAMAIPASLIVREAVERSVGPSRMHLDLRERFDMDWYSEYAHEAVGVEQALTPTSVRPAAFLDNLDAWFSGALFEIHPALVATGVVYVLIWTLLIGGILHRFAYQDPRFQLRSLLGHGADFFPRFTRLLVISGALYYGIYRLARWLFPRLDEAMRDVTVEHTALLVHLAAALVIGALLLLVKLTSDYARAATVLEGRRSMLLAVWTGLRFVVAHPLRTGGAYLTIGLVGLVLLAIYGWISPGQAQQTMLGVTWAFMVGQLMIMARLVQRLTAYATALEIYRDRLS